MCLTIVLCRPHLFSQLCSVNAGVVRDRVTKEGPKLHRKSTIYRSYRETKPLIHPAEKSCVERDRVTVCYMENTDKTADNDTTDPCTPLATTFIDHSMSNTFYDLSSSSSCRVITMCDNMCMKWSVLCFPVCVTVLCDHQGVSISDSCDLTDLHLPSVPRDLKPSRTFWVNIGITGWKTQRAWERDEREPSTWRIMWE